MLFEVDTQIALITDDFTLFQSIQEVEPSLGEIKRIREYSSEYSNKKTSIPRDLARKVAKIELTVE